MNNIKRICKPFILLVLCVLMINCETETMKQLIPNGLPLKNGNYTLVVNTDRVYGMIDDPNLLIQNRKLIGHKFDFLNFIPGEGKPTHSLSLYEGKERIEHISVINDDKLFLGNLREHLKPLKKIDIRDTKKPIEVAQDTIKHKTVYFLYKPTFKKYAYHFIVYLPTLKVKAKHPLDEKGQDPFINGNYAIETERKALELEIENRVSEQFPKGEFEVENVASSSRRGTFLVTAEATRVRDTLRNFLDDEDHYYFFNAYVEINCSLTYFDTIRNIDFASIFEGLDKVSQTDLQTFLNQKDISNVDTTTYPLPYFFEVRDTSYRISALKEVEYNLTYLEENKAIQKQ